LINWFPPPEELVSKPRFGGEGAVHKERHAKKPKGTRRPVEAEPREKKRKDKAEKKEKTKSEKNGEREKREKRGRRAEANGTHKTGERAEPRPRPQCTVLCKRRFNPFNIEAFPSIFCLPPKITN
jgi:hypothetical protein